nr:peptidylprolyl isomerase [uncultured Butyrivibrio sp.]
MKRVFDLFQMKSLSKFCCVALSLLSVCVILSGCGMDLAERKVVFTTGFEKDEVFRIEDSVCTIQEIMVYLINTQNGYENTFGSEIWQKETDNGTVESQLKESILAKVAQIKAMNLLATDMGIELDESEIEKAAQAASEYYSSLTDADIAVMHGVSQDTIQQIYSEYALADKLYDYIIRDINPEISDDEARTITVEQILIKTYEYNASGEKVPFNDSKKSTALARMKSVKNQLIDGASFEELQDNYNEADEATISFGKGEKEEAYEKAAFNLGNGEVSNIVETSEGYVLIKCLSTFNREETQVNKVRIVADRKREVFGQQYDAFVETLNKELNENLWNEVSISSNEEATTSSLWDVYGNYFE